MRQLVSLFLVATVCSGSAVAGERTSSRLGALTHSEQITEMAGSPGADLKPDEHPGYFLAGIGDTDGSATTASFGNPINTLASDSCEVAADVTELIASERFEDFEITVDPSDPEFNLIFAANTQHPRGELSDILVARLDGTTGRLSGMPRIIAANYAGHPRINGPEFAFEESLGLGVLYAGPRGVHAAWRPSGTSWHAFRFDVHGVPFPHDTPPALPGTTAGRHPGGSPPFDLLSYSEIFGGSSTRCEEVCYGNYTDPTRTDLAPALRAAVTLDLVVSTPHPAMSGYVIFNACSPAIAASTECGLFEILIDGKGGVEADTLLRLTPTAWNIQYAPGQGLRAGVHPVTGNLVVFGLRSGNLDVWESDTIHSVLTLVDSFTNISDDAGHTRVVEGNTALYLHFIVREGPEHGSYVTVFEEAPAPPEWILGRPGGSELVYFPAVDRLGLYYTKGVVDSSSVAHQLLVRCWVD